MSRIEPGTRREVGPFAWVFSHLAGRVAHTGPPNLFLTMAPAARRCSAAGCASPPG